VHTALRRDIQTLWSRLPSRETPVPEDRVAFASALGITPDPWQRDLLRSSSSRILLNCSRQSGKSTMAAIVALHRALYHPGSLVLILAPSERQAKETFSKVAAHLRDLGYPVRTDSYRKLGMERSNRSRIEALPGSEKTVRGFSGVDLLILDEAARVDDALYFAVRPMLAVSGGSLIMLSTPVGKRGVFFEEWTSGEGWERYEVKASECPRIGEAFLEEERKSLPARIYRQEYECSFEDVEDQVFAYELVEQAITEEISPLFEPMPRGEVGGQVEEVAPLFGGASR
jgi:nucleotide-binding universal stress UspA family protein